MPSFLPAVVASRFSSRSKGKERVSERGKPAEINIGVPMAVRHEGHVSKSGDHKFSPHTRVANQLGDGEVDWLKSEARNSGRAQNSRYDSWADNVNDEEQSARARTAWAKAGAAGLAAGKLRARRLRAELARVDAELQAAQAELHTRRKTLEHIDALADAQVSLLPPGWQEVFDAESGEHYYYHAETGQTTWEHPAAPPSSAPPSSSLPSGWMEVTDPVSGAVYYFNESTGQTSWDYPGTDLDQGGLAEASEPSVPTRNAVAVPLWKAIGVPEARASERAADFDEIERAVAAGEFEKAIELRDKVRLSSGRANSIHQMSADL